MSDSDSVDNDPVNQDYSLLKWGNPQKVDKDTDDTKESCDSFKIEEPRGGDLQEVLNAIIKPREWVENGITWMQYVSSEPAKRSDVLKLAEQFDKTLIDLNARETGFCEIRRSIYIELFDELIRQVAVNCVERGLLLLRIRDEAVLTLDTFRRLYESAVAFGIRKALEAEEGKKELEEEIYRLQKEKDALKEELDDITKKYDENERRYAERRNLDEATHKAQMEFLQKTNKSLKMQLESIIAPKK